MPATEASTFSAAIRLMRLNKPIGIFLVVWPALWALWIASEGAPDPVTVAIFIFGGIVMRSAGCVINDYADRDIDQQVSRTQDRPLATGELSPTFALVLFAILCALGLILVLLLNTATLKVAILAAILATLYPFTKRFTSIPQVFLGAAFACSVPMAFAAQTGEIPSSAWLIYIAVVIWTVTYDTFYAMVDREDDVKIGVKSTAILFGENDLLMTRILQGMALLTFVMIGFRFKLFPIYFFGMAVVAVLFVYQQYLILDRSRKGCFSAFMNNNWVGMTMFVSIAGSYLLETAFTYFVGSAGLS